MPHTYMKIFEGSLTSLQIWSMLNNHKCAWFPRVRIFKGSVNQTNELGSKKKGTPVCRNRQKLSDSLLWKVILVDLQESAIPDPEIDSLQWRRQLRECLTPSVSRIVRLRCMSLGMRAIRHRLHSLIRMKKQLYGVTELVKAMCIASIDLVRHGRLDNSVRKGLWDWQNEKY